MKVNSKAIYLLVTLIFSIIISTMVYLFFMKNKEPFVCNGFVGYELNYNDKIVTFNINQNFLIKNNGDGGLILLGEVIYGNREYSLNRRLEFLNRKKYQEDFFTVNVSGVHKSLSDTTPEELFRVLLGEIIPGDTVISLKLKRLDDKTYLVKNSMSNLFVCIESR